MAEIDRVKEKLADSPNLVGVLVYDKADKYAVVTEAENPSCIYTTRAELTAVNELLPDVRSQRVLLLNPAISHVHVCYSDGTINNTNLLDINRGSQMGFELPPPASATQDRLPAVYADELTMMKTLFHGIALFQGEGRKSQDMALILEKDHFDGQAHTKVADVVFIDNKPTDMDESGQANMLYMLNRIVDAIQQQYGSNPQYADLWRVVNAILSSQNVPLQEYLVAAHLLAEQRLIDLKELPGDIQPAWKRLYDPLFSAPARVGKMFETLFNGNTKQSDNTIIGSFIKDQLADLLLDDAITDESKPKIEPKKIAGTIEFNTTYMVDKFERLQAALAQSETDLKGYGEERVSEGRDRLLDTYYDIVTQKVKTLLNDHQTMNDVPGLDDAITALNWLFQNYPDWWAKKGDVRVYIYNAYNLGHTFIEGNYSMRYKGDKSSEDYKEYNRDQMAAEIVKYISNTAATIRMKASESTLR